MIGISRICHFSILSHVIPSKLSPKFPNSLTIHRLCTNLFQLRSYSVSERLKEKLTIWRLEQQGHVKTFGEFYEFLKVQKPSTNWPQKVVARDLDKKITVYEQFPDFAVKSGESITIKKAPSLLSPLHIAVKRKKIREIKKLIREGADVNVRGEAGETPLFQAVRGGNRTIVALLVKHGANPDLYEESNWNYDLTAFHLAISLELYDIVRFFVEDCKVPVNQPVKFNDYGWPPEPIDFAIPSPSSTRDMSPYKLAQAEKIAVLLLKEIGGKFIRNVDRLYHDAQKNGMHETAKLFVELGYIKES